MSDVAAELRALAHAATPGPWYFEAELPDSILRTRVGSEGHRRGVGDYAFIGIDTVGADQAPEAADAAYIARLSPNVALALAAVVSEAEKSVAMYGDEVLRAALDRLAETWRA